MSDIEKITAEVLRQYELAEDAAKKTGSDKYIGQMIAYDSILPFIRQFEKHTQEVSLPSVEMWKPADGDDLPEYDREVIAITDYDFGHYKVVYAHRPSPNGWNGRNIDTGDITHYEAERYDKGGWNQPHVHWWLDIALPYENKDKT